MTAMMRNLVMGLILRLGRPLLLASRQVVAYLYNTLKLPKLPDVEGYPHVVIETEFGARMAHFCVEAPYVDAEGDVVLPGPRRHCQYLDGAWGPISDDADTVSKTQAYVAWSNTDILNPDQSVFLAASEPIPIYE